MNVGLCEELRDLVGLDLLDEREIASVGALLSEHSKLASVLWVLSRDEAEFFGVDLKEFKSRLDVDALFDGWEALTEAYVNFRPKATREVVRRAIEAQVEAMEKTATAIAATLTGELMVGTIENLVSQAVNEAKEILTTSGP